jgi:flavin reductase (DIM6/NTAB) family NADH-FMN oxidoreductase RutF
MATITIEPSALSAGEFYHLLNAAIAPRPVAWISSLSGDGVANIAPHSYTTVFALNPPIVGFVSTGVKDTVRNVRATGDFVYHISSVALAERLNRTAANFPPEISEFDWAGLTKQPSDVVSSFRVLEAPIAFECRLVDVVQIGEQQSFLVLGEIVRAHLADAIMTGGRIDPVKLEPLGRLAGSQFSRLGEVFSLERPTYDGLLAAGAAPMPPVGSDDGA